jgi:hypothetical protein
MQHNQSNLNLQKIKSNKIQVEQSKAARQNFSPKPNTTHKNGSTVSYTPFLAQGIGSSKKQPQSYLETISKSVVARVTSVSPTRVTQRF